jgi:hypothetical protein
MADKDLPNVDEEIEDLDLDDVEDIDESALEEDLGDDEIAPVLDDDEEFDEDAELVADNIDIDEEDDNDDEDDDEEEEEDDDDDHDDETAEALEELENQELQLLDEEANEAMLVDEVAELRAMRREELTLNVDAQSQKADEFVCQSCFMVKRTSQLANKRKMICFDCVD